MRLGCEATAIDINPVAWFILKCTLEYPQKLAGQVRPLPKFALESEEFMEAYLKGTGKLSKTQAAKELVKYQRGLFPPPEADLAWHVRAWGWWVLQQARKDLERFYPTIDGKPTVAYLWARTVTCKNCRATIPLLKTRWLCKKDNRRVVLTMEANSEKSRVDFGIHNDVPVIGATTSQRRMNDKQVGAGTMTRSGVTCPCCNKPSMTLEDVQFEGLAGRLNAALTAVVVEDSNGRAYRIPRQVECEAAEAAKSELERLYREIPFEIPQEPITEDAKRNTWCVPYGVNQFSKLFNDRQLYAIGTFLVATRRVLPALQEAGYSPDWIEAILGFLAIAVDRLADRASVICQPDPSPTQSGIKPTFQRFSLPMQLGLYRGSDDQPT